MSDSPPPAWARQVPAGVWEHLRTAERDVSTLIRFLIEANDGRLQAHFLDTRPALSSPAARLAEPPCDTYQEFLTRLSDIAIALNDDGAREPAMPTAGPNGRPPLRNIPFLYWSRDFLAAVAAPATADSIVITKQYVRARLELSLLRSLRDQFRASVRFFGSTGPELDETERDDDRAGETATERRRMAEWMASLVRRREFGALILIVVVIVISTYSISGQLILRSRQAVIEQAKDISRRIESLEKDLYPVQPPVPVSSAAAAGVERSGDLSGGPAATIVPLCDLPFTQTGSGSQSGPSAAPGAGRFLLRYQAVAQISLCAERQRNLNEGLAIAAQVLSWLNWMRDLGRFGVDISALFGDDRDVTRRLGENAYLCYMVTHRPPPAQGAAPSSQPAAAAPCGEFQDILEYYGRVPEAMLQALTLYLLPSLYGALGAILATIRYVRGRVGAALLTYVDRGRIQQDWVLGLVLGAVMGLFADYLSKASPVEGITLSAVALLAGYNVSAVFGLFEEVSNRLFGPSGKASPGTPGGLPPAP